jgi:hypothetical protein
VIDSMTSDAWSVVPATVAMVMAGVAVLAL